MWRPVERGLVWVVLAWGVLVGCGVLGGCSGGAGGPYASTPGRSPLRAEELTLRAAQMMETDPHGAEALLREALAADLFYGPAHNNLGVLHLGRGELYEAAAEFEWARRLMPGHPDPRLNLGVALERAGRVDEAMGAYAAALELREGHLPAMQALARCQVRHGRADERTAGWLGEIAMRGDDAWRAWAREQAVRMGEGMGAESGGG